MNDAYARGSRRIQPGQSARQLVEGEYCVLLVAKAVRAAAGAASSHRENQHRPVIEATKSCTGQQAVRCRL